MPSDIAQKRKAIQELIANYNIINNIESIKSDWDDAKTNILKKHPLSFFANGLRIVHAIAAGQLELLNKQYPIEDILDAITKDENGDNRCTVNDREEYIKENVKSSNCCFMPFKRACLSCEEATPNFGWNIDSKVNKILTTLHEKTQNANDIVKKVRCMNAIKQIYEIYPDIYNSLTREKMLCVLRETLEEVLNVQRNTLNDRRDRPLSAMDDQEMNNRYSKIGLGIHNKSNNLS